MFKKQRLLASILAVVFSASANASVQSEMQSWFNEIGAYGNVTGAQVLQGQTGTTFTGGNLYMRLPQRNYQLMSVAPPSVKAGCGGIDLFAGSFSFINAEQLTALLRNLANNAIGVAFELAIESISPELSNILKWAQDQASKINNMNLNSCQLATGLMTASWPDRKAAEKVATRKGIDPNLNISTDSFNSWWKSFTDSIWQQKSEENAIVASQPALKEKLAPTNVTWSALSRMGISDPELRELMMSMIGTVIITPTPDDGSKPKFEDKAPPQKISFKDFIGDPASSGTQVRIMKCPDSDCLNPGEGTATLAPFSKYTRDRIASIVDKVQSRQNQNLTPEEYAILQGTSIPIWKLISLTPAGPAAQTYVDTMSQAIAVDLAYTYFDAIAKEVQKAVSNSKSTDSAANKDQLERMEKRIADVRQEARAMLQAELQKVTTFAQMQQAVARLNEEIKRGLPKTIRESLDLFGG